MGVCGITAMTSNSVSTPSVTTYFKLCVVNVSGFVSMRSPPFDHYKTRRCTLTGKIEIFHPSHSVTKHSDPVCSRLIGMCSIITSLLIHCYISHSYILTVRFRYNMVTFPRDTYSTRVAHSGRRCVYLCGVYGFKV